MKRKAAACFVEKSWRSDIPRAAAMLYLNRLCAHLSLSRTVFHLAAQILDTCHYSEIRHVHVTAALSLADAFEDDLVLHVDDLLRVSRIDRRTFIHVQSQLLQMIDYNLTASTVATCIGGRKDVQGNPSLFMECCRYADRMIMDERSLNYTPEELAEFACKRTFFGVCMGFSAPLKCRIIQWDKKLVAFQGPDWKYFVQLIDDELVVPAVISSNNTPITNNRVSILA